MGGGASVDLGSRVSESQAKAWCGPSFDPAEWSELLKAAKKSHGDGCVPVDDFLAVCKGRSTHKKKADAGEPHQGSQSAATHMFDSPKLESTASFLAAHFKRLRDSKYIYNLWRRINFKCHLNKAGELKLLQVERLVSVCPVWKFPKVKDVAAVHYTFRNSCKTGQAMGTTFLQAHAYVETTEFPILVRDLVSRCLLNEFIVSRGLDAPDFEGASKAPITLSLPDFAKLCAVVPGVDLDMARAAGKDYAVSLAMGKECGQSQAQEAVEQRELMRNLMMDQEDDEFKPFVVDAALWSKLGDLVLPADISVAGMSAAHAEYEAKKAAKRAKKRKAGTKASTKPGIDKAEYYKRLFNMYDIDKSGAIDADEIMTMLQSMGQTPDKDHVDGLIKEYDQDNNGELEIDEFFKMMETFYAK